MIFADDVVRDAGFAIAVGWDVRPTVRGDAVVMLNFITAPCAGIVHEATDAQHFAYLLVNFIESPEDLRFFVDLQCDGVPVGALSKEYEARRASLGDAAPSRPSGEWGDFVAAAKAEVGPDAGHVRVATLALRKMWALPAQPERPGLCGQCGLSAPFGACPHRPPHMIGLP